MVQSLEEVAVLLRVPDGLLRRLAHLPRHIVEGSLHPLRRRWARARIARLAPPRSVLFVCNGNICRSPYAAAKARRLLPPAIAAATRIDSAGFIGPNRPVPPEAIEVASRHGVDLSAHCSSLLTAERLRATDLIVAMDNAQRRALRARFGQNVSHVLVLGDLDPQKIDTRAIRDPVAQPAEIFEETYARIDRCLLALVKTALGRGFSP